MQNKYKELLIRLKTCRIIAGFKSARLFATTFSIPEKTYSQHENGKRKLSIDSLLIYSTVLKINPLWLLTGEGFPSDSDEFNNSINEYLTINYNQRVVLPKLSHDQKCQIDSKLLTEVLSKITEIISHHNIDIDHEDIIEFAYSVYNSIIGTNANSETKANLIDLATKSLLAGRNIKKYKDKASA